MGFRRQEDSGVFPVASYLVTDQDPGGFFVVFIPALILGVLGFVTLRRWETTARQAFLESNLRMAAMAVHMVEGAIHSSQEELFNHIRAVLWKDPPPSALHTFIARLESQSPLGGALYLLASNGRVVYPQFVRRAPLEMDERILNLLRQEATVAQESPARTYRLTVSEGGEATLAYAWVPATGTVSYMVGFRLDRANVRAQFFAKALEGGPKTMGFLAILTEEGDVVYSPHPLKEGSHKVAFARFTEVFPGWRIVAYQRDGMAFEDTLHQQALITATLLGMLVLAIAYGLLVIFRTVRREMEMAQFKSDLVAHVSHDLKTPISLIRMFAETLEMGRIIDDAKRQEYYRIIAQESERLSHLIDNFLDFSRIDVGKVRYQFQPCEVAPLVVQTLDAFQYQLDRLGFKVDLDIQPDMPDVTLDPHAFRQALGNLLDNAIKYSRDRKVIRVEAMVWQEELRCSVADQGIGIDPTQIPRVFEKFYRVARSEAQSPRGSGIGLTVVKHIAEAHGGKVIVESTHREGSTFTLIIPLDPQRRRVA
jgi:signal transduction histidine kinase